MYQLSPTPNFSYNAELLEGFKRKEWKKYSRHLSDLIKDWVSHPTKFRAYGNGVYSISSLEIQFKYITMMTCRLYGSEDTTHLFLSWVHLIHIVIEGCSFDWAKLLSYILTSWITEYRTQRENGKVASFFMFTYVIDVICFMMPFPLMSWSWTPSDVEPIHVYHSKLW
jgi:hypothetical protein